MLKVAKTGTSRLWQAGSWLGRRMSQNEIVSDDRKLHADN